MALKIAVVVPPVSDLNTMYSASPRLTAWLRGLGHEVEQIDLSLELFLTMFSRTGLERLFAAIKKDHPAFNAVIMIPADGPTGQGMDPMYVEKDNPMVVALKEGHEAASGKPAMLGAGLRIGNVGDGNRDVMQPKQAWRTVG